MDARRADRYNSGMRFIPLMALALVGPLLVACGGPDPEQAARYAALVEDKHIIQCRQGYDRFRAAIKVDPAKTTYVDAPLKSIDIFPSFLFVNLEEDGYSEFIKGYDTELRDRMEGLRVQAKVDGAALKKDFSQPSWQNYCRTMQLLAASLRTAAAIRS